MAPTIRRVSSAASALKKTKKNKKSSREHFSLLDLSVVALLHNLVEQLASRHQLHHQIAGTKKPSTTKNKRQKQKKRYLHVLLIFKHLPQSDNVGMIHLLHNLNLSLQRQLVGVPHRVAINDLHRISEKESELIPQQ